LHPKKTAENKKFNEWLFETFNPKGNKIEAYFGLKYKQENLTDYYLTNNAAESTSLAQEARVKTLSLIVNGSMGLNTVSTSSPIVGYDNTEVSNFSINAQLLINLDPVTNKHSLFAGVTYYTPIDSEGTGVLNPQSTFNRPSITTATTIDLASITFGYQHNIHFSKVTFSPYISMEPMFFKSQNRKAVIRQDGSFFYNTVETNANPIAFNIGLRALAFKKAHVFIAYGRVINADFIASDGADEFEVSNTINRINIGVGYTIF